MSLLLLSPVTPGSRWCVCRIGASRRSLLPCSLGVLPASGRAIRLVSRHTPRAGSPDATLIIGWRPRALRDPYYAVGEPYRGSGGAGGKVGGIGAAGLGAGAGGASAGASGGAAGGGAGSAGAGG